MKILLIDHHELFRAGLRYILQRVHGGAGELFEEGEWEAGLQCVRQHPDLDLVLLELETQGCKGVSSIKLFRERFPQIPLVIVSGKEDFHAINKVLKYGASGFVGKSAPETMLLGALKSVLEGGIYVPPQMLIPPLNPKEYRLTQRQLQILEALGEGLSNKQISERFDLAEGTVKVHVAAVYQALRVKSRREAAGIAGQMDFAGAGYAC